MAKFANPRKKYNFSIQITPDPINPFQFQKVTNPDIEIEQTAHGDTNHDVKTPGRITIGNILLDKLQPSDQADSYFWAWLDTCQSSMIGGGAPPEIVKKAVTITEFAEDGATVLNTWVWFGVWPCKINGQEWDRQSSDNTVESVELCIDRGGKV